MIKRGISHHCRYFSDFPAKFLAILAVTIVPLCAFAQGFDELDRLVFDPVPIDPEERKELQYLDLHLQLLPMNDTREDEQPVPPAVEPEMPGALEITRNIEAYQDAVRRIEAADGPFAPELFESLVDLAGQYQLANEHETAIEILERAEHISRVNHGLYHPEQYASIEKMIDSYLALGDYASANEKQGYLVFLNEQHYGQLSANILPSLVELAETNMDNFNRAINSDAPVISFSSNVGPGRPSRQATPKQMAFRNLYVAQQNYLHAIATMIDNKQFFDPMLLDLEYSFLETLLLQAFRSAIIRDPDYYMSYKSTSTGSLVRQDFFRRNSNGYNQGKDAFERILVYLRNNPKARVYQLVNALMEYGDWNMLFGRGNLARARYQEAYDLVQNLEIEKQYVEEFFRPQMPVHLPLITAKPNSREKFGIAENAEIEHLGYIDIAFTISKYGRAKRFDVLATSGQTNSNIERRLIRYLRNSPFRPYFSEDEGFEDREVTLRYYFTFADQVI